jgi:hypothetical protein
MSMTMSEHSRGSGSPESGRRRRDHAKTRVGELEASIPEETLAGGKTFDQLPLYEKKSVLIERELE